ncbi:MAG: HEAT repeat domain-containing protein [Planctomycetota bacterium]|nr:HEAT repeat domain-containing protein [Planctomycetota bacterium]
MADLRELTERLRRLGTRRPSPEARTEVLAGLSSKWEGVQVVATGVLGRWGDRESVERLREFLSECFGREAGWGIREVIVRALRPAVTEADVGWVLDLYFRLEGWLPKHELQWLVIALPPRAARARLVAALRDPRWDNRHAAVKAIGNMDYPDRRELLLALRADPDEDVRRSVQLLAERQAEPTAAPDPART